MDLLSYADQISVQHGERIGFKVSTDLPSYEATIVRLTHPMFENAGSLGTEEITDVLASASHTGRHQAIYPGSYMVVPDCPPIHGLGQVTFATWMYPTTPQNGTRQSIMAKWSGPDAKGIGLFIEPEGDIAAWLVDASGHVVSVRSGTPLHAASWYFVAFTFDVTAQQLCLYQKLLSCWSLDHSWVVMRHATDGHQPVAGAFPLVIAGAYDGISATGRVIARYLYNGKIDRPRIFGQALEGDEITALANGAAPQAVGHNTLAAAWDFSRNMESGIAVDLGQHALHGTLVNMPARAVTGYNWTGQHLNAREAPDQYGAIHFHEDDLEDAGWEDDFEVAVPHNLRSGVYAARLSSGDAVAYVPFVIRPRRGCSAAPVAYLSPTMTHAAYANRRLVVEFDPADSTGLSITLNMEGTRRDSHPDIGLSLYDVHSDGSGCFYASRLRPYLPATPWNLQGDHHLIGWLERKQFGYDVLTDDDLHREGFALLEPYRVVVTGTHPEYCTEPMLAALEEYLDAGGRLMYLGGNGFYWVTSVDGERPHVLEVRRGVGGTRTWESAPGEAYHSTTGEPGGLWRYRGRAPQRLVGVGFAAAGWGSASGYRRATDSLDERVAFIFDGIGENEIIGDFGLAMDGAAGDELDRLDYSLGTPPHAFLLASSFGHTDAYQIAIEDMLIMLPGQGGTRNPGVRADMVYFETPRGGAVFSVGSINWCASLSHANYNNNVARITENVLRHFST